MQRFLFLSFFPTPLALSLFLPLSLFLFFVYSLSLHQDAIIQDISEEELKALTVEEGPRVLSESCDANTHTHKHMHAHAHTL